MKNTLIFVFLSLSFNIINPDTIPKIDSNNTLIIQAIGSPRNESFNDTVTINNNLEKRINQNTRQKNKDDIFFNQYQMPWIVALIIGILTVITTIYINIRSEKFKREIVNNQLNCTKDLTISQIEIAKQNALLDFKKSVLSVNRSSWLNEFRELISRVITLIYTITNKNFITVVEVEELHYLTTKIELMLDPEKDKAFVSALNAINLCCIEIISSNRNIEDLDEYVKNIKLLAIVILKSKWNQVKNGL